MRTFTLTLALAALAATPAFADGMTKHEKAAAERGMEPSGDVKLPAPQPGVVVNIDRGVRVWRPTGTEEPQGQPSYPSCAPSYQPSYSSSSGRPYPSGYGGRYGLGYRPGFGGREGYYGGRQHGVGYVHGGINGRGHYGGGEQGNGGANHGFQQRPSGHTVSVRGPQQSHTAGNVSVRGPQQTASHGSMVQHAVARGGLRGQAPRPQPVVHAAAPRAAAPHATMAKPMSLGMKSGGHAMGRHR